MSELHLDSLEIKNFRCFEHLVIERLGRVNLIVGKNSVGKTALLEALWLLVSGARWPIVHKILYDRNELVIYNMPMQSVRSLQLDAIKSLFTNNSSDTSLEFNVKTGKASVSFSPSAEGLTIIYRNPKDINFSYSLPEASGMIMGIGMIETADKQIERKWYTQPWPDLPQQEFLEYDVIEQSKKTKTVFIPVNGLRWQAVSTYWDDIALSNKEEAIAPCLQLIDPLTTRFTFKGENMKDRVRYSVAKTGRFPNPVPMAKMGEGIQRIFAIALAMTTASNGYLLIDEIETGLYHRVQADVWRAIFKLAHEWNVQVFATTHSWDCVEAFQKAAVENENDEAMLIRLQRRKSGDGIVSVLYDKEDLTVVTEDGIEVR